MKLLLVTPVYPSENNTWAGMFIHKRVKKYMAFGHKVEVFLTTQRTEGSYTFDDVRVHVGDHNGLLKTYLNYTPEKLLLHFVNRYTVRFLREIDYMCKAIIWVHGWEALNVFRNYFDFSVSLGSLRSFLVTSHQNFVFRKFIQYVNSMNNFRFIFVSEWMKKMTENDNLVKVKNFDIIPNGIDTRFFQYVSKDESMRKKILTIRPFTSKKYAMDIVVDVINALSKKSYFRDLSFEIYGDGPLYDKIFAKLVKSENVKIHRKMLTHEEIKVVHMSHGIFLCPTRMDAQGVSMCEAMSSGLVPISSNNTAIPEFVAHGETGFLCRNVDEFTDAIEELYLNPKKFTKISENAAKAIREKCGEDYTISKELEIIKNL